MPDNSKPDLQFRSCRRLTAAGYDRNSVAAKHRMSGHRSRNRCRCNGCSGGLRRPATFCRRCAAGPAHGDCEIPLGFGKSFFSPRSQGALAGLAKLGWHPSPLPGRDKIRGTLFHGLRVGGLRFAAASPVATFRRPAGTFIPRRTKATGYFWCRVASSGESCG